MSRRVRIVVLLVFLSVLASSLLPQQARADELTPVADSAEEVSYTPPSNPRFYVELKDENGEYIRDDDYSIIHIEPTWTACGECEWAVGIYEPIENRTYATLVIRPAGGAEEGWLDDWGDGYAPWHDEAYTEVLIGESVHARTCRNMFTKGGTSLEGKVSDFSGLDTSDVTDASDMFFRNDSKWFKKLDLSGLDFSKVTTMDGMFGWCDYLASLKMSGDTPSLTSMNGMFWGCTSITWDQVPLLDTSGVTSETYISSHTDVSFKINVG